MNDFTELIMVLEQTFRRRDTYHTSEDSNKIIKDLFTKQGEQSVINFIKSIQEGSLNIKELLGS